MADIRSRRTRRIALAGIAATALVAAPLQAQRAGAAITPAEAQQGAKYHQQFLDEFGGAMTGTQAAYVEQIGKNIAVQSGLANSQSAFTVTLLNSSVDNAFAIPGGYVYVTRQLVSLMNNEAELAGVLGHEVGHVAARHSAARERAAQRNSILGALGSILSGVLLGNGALGSLGQQVFSAAPQLLTAKYSRKQETEADSLGIRYLAGAGYDPHARAAAPRHRPARAALADDRRHHRHGQGQARLGRARDRLGLTALFGFDPGVGARGVDQRHHREPETPG
jgi:predicted Zn-dependent protease